MNDEQPVRTADPKATGTKAPRKFNYRKLFWKWHKYAGLLGGPLFVLIAVTGGILVFSPEIDFWLRPDVKTIPIPSVESPRVSDQAMVDLVRKQFPEEPLILYWQNSESNRPYEFWLLGDIKTGIHEVWVDPYTGKIVGDRLRETAFIRIVEQLHRRLLTGEIGSSVIEFITGWGIVLTLTGLFMWWPKTWKALRQGLTIPLRGSPYKINWRAHNTLGAWTSIFVLLMCLTGMVVSTYSGRIYHSILNATGDPFGAPTPKSVLASDSQTIAVDRVLKTVQEEMPEIGPVTIQWPRGETGCYVVSTYRETRPKWSDRNQFHQWHFDQYSGEVLHRAAWSDLHPMLRFRTFSMTIHYGSIFGWPTKLLAIVSCLIVPLLVLSGFLIWWWKKKSTNPPQRETQPISKAFVACMIGVGILFPTIGVSFVVLLAWEATAFLVSRLRQ
ncbi:PepSY domain-containing protein [Bremerella sp. JC770]|uniref:PepSY-associated TM helix domain-containing protein n=1 Tax=Bremerella sp. JC770 TaxID=3232137 RepID=UPI0034584885